MNNWEVSDSRYNEHFKLHVETFLSGLDFKLDYEFDFILNISMPRGNMYFRIPLNRKQGVRRRDITPHLEISSSVLTWMKFLSGAEDLDEFFHSGRIGVMGDLYLLGALSCAMRLYCRNSMNSC